jgi:hypothetical protein
MLKVYLCSYHYNQDNQSKGKLLLTWIFSYIDINYCTLIGKVPSIIPDSKPLYKIGGGGIKKPSKRKKQNWNGRKKIMNSFHKQNVIKQLSLELRFTY